MKVIGVDLSGPRNIADTCLVSFEERGDEIYLINIHEGADDDRILEAVSSLGQKERIVIGLDAPLSYNAKGGDRPSDAELRRLVHPQAKRVGILPPTMSRMVYLTLRGITLTRELESLKPHYDLQMIEIHPGACMLLRGAGAEDVTGFKKDPSARRRLLGWLKTKGVTAIDHEQTVTDHFVAACAAALGAWQWALGKSVWCFPADPPHHPYDFAC